MRSKYHAALIALGSLALLPAAAHGQDRASTHIDALGQCRALSDSGARAACYDQAYDALIAARDRKEVMIVDREAVREARRGLFGLNLPSLKLFGGKDGGDEEEVSEIESTIRSATSGSGGEWIITLVDGARWRQIDDKFLMPPKQGQSINIRKGTFGAYIARVNGKNGIKVVRLN